MGVFWGGAVRCQCFVQLDRPFRQITLSGVIGKTSTNIMVYSGKSVKCQSTFRTRELYLSICNYWRILFYNANKYIYVVWSRKKGYLC